MFFDPKIALCIAQDNLAKRSLPPRKISRNASLCDLPAKSNNLLHFKNQLYIDSY
jgi:hypothetical protein